MRRVPIWLVVSVLLAGAPAARGQQKPSANASGPADRYAAIALQPPPEARGSPGGEPAARPAGRRTGVRAQQPFGGFPARHIMRTREEFGPRWPNCASSTSLPGRLHPAAPATRARVELDTFQFRMEEPEDLQRHFPRLARRRLLAERAHPRLPRPDGLVGRLLPQGARHPRRACGSRRPSSCALPRSTTSARSISTAAWWPPTKAYFAPFEVEITPYLRRDSENVLVVRIQNESIMTGADSWNGPGGGR